MSGKKNLVPPIRSGNDPRSIKAAKVSRGKPFGVTLKAWAAYQYKKNSKEHQRMTDTTMTDKALKFLRVRYETLYARWESGEKISNDEIQWLETFSKYIIANEKLSAPKAGKGNNPDDLGDLLETL